MIECSWCGADITKRHRLINRRGEQFCTMYHRTASNAALKRLTDQEHKQKDNTQ